MFGNTAVIAEAVAHGLALEGMDVSSPDVAEAPALAAVDVDLLVVGGPTHAFSLSRESTREDAVRQGASPEHVKVGLREWLQATQPAEVRHPRLAVAFDTRVRRVRYLPKTAGTRGAHVLQRLGFTLLERPMGFLVEDTPGPLLAGETERAVAWGRQLAKECRDRSGVSL
jgi:hypothetical protein